MTSLRFSEVQKIMLLYNTIHNRIKISDHFLELGIINHARIRGLGI